jgi:NDP-sugar pyrophosphorylase family protein
MQKPTLLILAAGMGSRYGGIKQMDHFGPQGETLIDYSIYDAIRSGFGKIVFIIRKDFSEVFEKTFNAKLGGQPVEVQYVYQGLDSFVKEDEVPAGRKKPWGTAHAVLCAKDAIEEPFAVINADDFYGREVYKQMYTFLTEECGESRYSVIGYELGKTLSEHGTVSRGVCTLDEIGNLDTITERTKIARNEEGKPVYTDEQGNAHIMAEKTPVSMNFWGFDPSIFSLSEEMFARFVEERGSGPKAEFLIPTVVDYFIANRQGTVKVIPTPAQWFGVTYQQDAPVVREKLQELVQQGVYPEKLWI